MTDLNADNLVKLLHEMSGDELCDNCTMEIMMRVHSRVDDILSRAAMQDGAAVDDSNEWYSSVQLEEMQQPANLPQSSWHSPFAFVVGFYGENRRLPTWGEMNTLYTHPSPVNGAVEGVKGLEWEYGQKTARASVPFGEYQVDEYTETDGIGYAAIFNDSDELGEFPIIDEAIAACQADFAKRVSSCLSTLATPTPAVGFAERLAASQTDTDPEFAAALSANRSKLYLRPETLSPEPSPQSGNAVDEGMREALEPFAHLAKNIPDSFGDGEIVSINLDYTMSPDEVASIEDHPRGGKLASNRASLLVSMDGITAGHFRRAAAALSTPKQEDGK